MVAEFLKKILQGIGWTLVAITAFLFCLYAGISDYMGNVSAFERMNYEMKQLIYDALLGQYLGALIPGATFVQTYSLLLVFFKMLALFLGSHFIFGALVSARDCLRQWDNRENRRFHIAAITEHAMYFAVTAIPCGVILWFDYWLYRYRAMCDFLNANASDMAEVVMMVPSWNLFVEEYHHLAAAEMIPIATIGYTMLAVVGCLSLELTKLKATESFTWAINLLENKAVGLISPDYAEEDTYDEYDYQPEDETYDAEQYEDLHGDCSDAYGVDARPDTPPQEAAIPELYDVVGAAAPQRVTREEAMRHPEQYHYNMQTDIVYDMHYFHALHGRQE